MVFGTPTTFSLSNLPLLGVLLLTVAASVAVPFSRSHVEGVLVLSIVGFMVGIFYVIVSAPDLAMTQIVIETITLVVFLLVIEKLPTFYSEAKPTLERGRDLGVSVLVGVTVAVTVLAARSSAPDKIADLLLRNSVPEGGGHNVVNVILVDFRGFDTLGETTVVGLAAVGVLTLVRMRG
ncbi:MAG: hydrogen gas-evolving membrane-bound hydrogenase subunit E, partial [Halobacteria archaeon]|nr:hydrogen gas-evolving membrane-bound hydrogenase subunit E [Halobacteria archaeon]